MNIYLVRHGESEANVDRSVCRERPDHDIKLSPLGYQQAHEAGAFLLNYFSQMKEPQAGVPDLQVRIGGPYIRSTPRLRIWCSPYQRARQTADVIAHHLKQLEMDAVVAGPDLRVSHERGRWSLSRNCPLWQVDRREDIALSEQDYGLFDGHLEEDWPTVHPAEYAHYKKHELFSGIFWARLPLGESRSDVALRVKGMFGTLVRDQEKHGIHHHVIVAHGVTNRAFAMQWCHHPWEWMEQAKNPMNCSVYHVAGQGKDHGYIFKGDRDWQPNGVTT